MPASVFYQCQRCAHCCRWPGDVVVTEDEVEAIAAYLRMPTAAFIQRHTKLRRDRRGLSLTEKLNGECEFLDGVDCRLQAVKPAQCRGFPNTWNFPGWRQVCEAIPVTTAEVDG